MIGRSELFSHLFKRIVLVLVCFGIFIGIGAVIRGPHTHTDIGVAGVPLLIIYPVIPCVLLFFEAVHLFSEGKRKLSMVDLALLAVVVMVTFMWMNGFQSI